MYEDIVKFSEWRFGNKNEAYVRHDHNFLCQFAIFMHDKRPEEVREEDITEYIRLHYTMERKRNGVAGRVSSIRTFYSYLRMKGRDVIDPQLIKIPKKEWTDTRVIPEEEYRTLLEVIPDLKRGGNYHKRNRGIIMLLWDSGMRVGELCSLRTSDMDFVNMLASVKTEKNRTSIPFRNIFWTEETNERLLEWNKRRAKLSGEYFFCQTYGELKGGGITGAGIGSMLRKYAMRNGLNVWNAHSFRHAFGERMASKGAQDSVISSLLGHAHVESSFRYTRLSKVSMREKYRELARG